MAKDFEFPELTQAPITHIDLTPDENLALRILKAYREDCKCKWSSEKDTHKFILDMNKIQDKRAEILDRAIKILKDNM